MKSVSFTCSSFFIKKKVLSFFQVILWINAVWKRKSSCKQYLTIDLRCKDQMQKMLRYRKVSVIQKAWNGINLWINHSGLLICISDWIGKSIVVISSTPNCFSLKQLELLTPASLISKNHKLQLPVHTRPRPKLFVSNWSKIISSVTLNCLELSYPIRVLSFLSQFI